VTHHLELPELLWLAERLPGDPAADDLGALEAAAFRHQAGRMDTDYYGSVWLKAAALLHTVVLLRPLEHSNHGFGFLAARGFLEANGISIDPKPSELHAVFTAVEPGMAGVHAVARVLRQWAGEAAG
jgi:prophage maintenance system killer protein